MRTLAPEIAEHEGRLFVTGYRHWGNSGIFMSRTGLRAGGEDRF